MSVYVTGDVVLDLDTLMTVAANTNVDDPDVIVSIVLPAEAPAIEPLGDESDDDPEDREAEVIGWRLVAVVVTRWLALVGVGEDMPGARARKAKARHAKIRQVKIRQAKMSQTNENHPKV